MGRTPAFHLHSCSDVGPLRGRLATAAAHGLPHREASVAPDVLRLRYDGEGLGGCDLDGFGDGAAVQSYEEDGAVARVEGG